MKRVTVVLNNSEVERIAKSVPVRAELLRRAQAIATAGNRESKDGFEASVVVGRNRAHASVITSGFRARWHHARHNTLLRSIGAGRRV